MKEKIKQLLGTLLESGVLLLIVFAVFAAVSFLGGNFMALFGFSYESVGSLLLYFVAGELISLPLELVVVGMSQTLYRQGHGSRWQVNLLYIPLDTLVTIFAFWMADQFMSSVAASGLSLWMLGFCAAVITVPIKKAPSAK